MYKISLKDWVILITIIPTVFIGISLAAFFSYNYYHDLDNALTSRSKSIIEPIAIASANAIKNRNREQLRQLIGFAHRSHSNLISNIVVFTDDNQVFVTSAYNGNINKLRLSPTEKQPLSTQMQKFDDFVVFRTPIIDESDPINQLTGNSSNQWHKSLGYIAMQIDTKKLQYAQQNKIIIAFALVALGALFSAFFALRLIQKVTRPITSMVQVIDRIREGKLDSRVSGTLIGELNFLKNGINSMAQSIGAYHDEMQGSIDQATIDLRETLDQLEIQNVELDLAKRKAQDANRVKSEFLANMSHELRTPLNGVIGFTRQVLKTPLTETQRDYLQTIENSANNLLAIINDILDFSKLDAGKMLIENIPFSLRESIEESIILMAPSAHNKNIEFSLRIAEQLPDSFIGDAMRIKQVFVNLTNNAIKFTEQGSVTIDVEAAEITQQYCVIKVTVRDTGVGINIEKQKTIFDAFSQADKSVSRLYGGTGLGLVISKHLATEMQGDIGFYSEENNGATFWFTFRCEINPIPMLQPLNTSELANKNILYFEPHDHSRITTSEIMSNWQMKVTPLTKLEQLTAFIAKQDDEQHYDFALIRHDVLPKSINDLKVLISNLKTKIANIHLAINSSSPNLQEALIASGAKSCISTPITAKKLAKALLAKNSGITSVEHEQKELIPIKVLAVDDNLANLKLIKALLLEQVTEVLTSANGKEAVELCQKEKFALIYMDIQMPVMDGISALKAIKANSLNSETPIIAVTAHALSEEKKKLIDDGFDDYMTKPIDEAMLRHTIYEYCDLDRYLPPAFSHVNNKNTQNTNINNLSQSDEKNNEKDNEKDKFKGIIDWSLALSRTGNKAQLAQEMFTGLVNSLPETAQNIKEALACQDHTLIKTLIHKLNGACCYSGVPNLANISMQIETSLKKEATIDDLEPEFLEFFEHVETLLAQQENIAKEYFS